MKICFNDLSLCAVFVGDVGSRMGVVGVDDGMVSAARSPSVRDDGTC
jgi:hypothetical protein